MIGLLQLEELDHLLEELDRLACIGTSRAEFLAVVLQRIRFVLSAKEASFWVPIVSEAWKPLAVSGISSVELPEGALLNLPEEGRTVSAGNDKFLAVPVVKQNSQLGAIVVLLGTQLDSASISQIGKFCQAIGEIISDYETAQQQQFFTVRWPGVQRLLSQLGKAESIDESAVLVVNSLSAVLGAQRVSLAVRRGLKSSKVLSVSGVSGEIKNTDSLKELCDLCQKAFDRNQPVVVQPGSVAAQPSDPTVGTAGPLKSIAEYSVTIPICDFSAVSSQQRIANESLSGSSIGDTAICFEWKDYEDFLQGTQRLALTMPVVTSMWYAQRRWLGLPAWVRGLGKYRQSKISNWHRTRLWRWLIVIGLVGLIGWLLVRPTDMRIEMQGVLQPVYQRTVFAGLDGVVEQLLIKDNALVTQGQALLTMKSSSLEIASQETIGEIQANQEKLDALAVSVNQLNRDNADQAATINRVAAEIGQLETQRKTLQKKLEAYQSENLRLSLSAPIDGLVIASDLEALLDSRPVRRGDALLRIVQTSGPWHLVLSIADRDIGYVRSAQAIDDRYSGQGQLPEQRQRDLELEFVFSSSPDRQHRAKLVWLSPAARNPRGDGVFVDAHASVDRSEIQDAYVGATVYAYLNVGQYPTWFVWSRPLVEAIQRKIWFATSTENSK